MGARDPKSGPHGVQWPLHWMNHVHKSPPLVFTVKPSLWGPQRWPSGLQHSMCRCNDVSLQWAVTTQNIRHSFGWEGVISTRYYQELLPASLAQNNKPLGQGCKVENEKRHPTFPSFPGYVHPHTHMNTHVYTHTRTSQFHKELLCHMPLRLWQFVLSYTNNGDIPPLVWVTAEHTVPAMVSVVIL